MKKIILDIKKQIVKYKNIVIPFLIFSILAAILLDCKEYFHTVNENSSPFRDGNVNDELYETEIENKINLKEEFKLYFYSLSDSNNNPEIRVLLSNPKGGYFFDRLNLSISDSYKVIWTDAYTGMNKEKNKELVLNVKDFPLHDFGNQNTCVSYADQMTLEKICTISKEEKKDQINITSDITTDSNLDQTDSNLSGGIYITNKDNSSTFPGTLEIYRNPQGLFMVNVLPMEEYLKYVVPGEMPASYPLDALMAQAVCARTYGYQSLLNPHFPEYYANVDDTTQTQVYHTKEISDSTTEAITQTTGLYLEQNGKIGDIFYYSTSWGMSSDTDLWDTSNMKKDLNYQKNIFTETEFKDMITSVNLEDNDYGEAYYRWQFSCECPEWNDIYSVILQNLDQDYYVFTNGEIEDKPRISSKEILQDIRILERGSGGGVIRLEIETNRHSYLIMGEYNIRKLLFAFSGKCYKGNGEQAQNLSLLPSSFFYLEKTYKDEKINSFVLLGGGLGHGIGMSQNGAKNLARKGYHYQDILKLYYEHCKICKRM